MIGGRNGKASESSSMSHHQKICHPTTPFLPADGEASFSALQEAVEQCMKQIHEADKTAHMKWKEAFR